MSDIEVRFFPPIYDWEKSMKEALLECNTFHAVGLFFKFNGHYADNVFSDISEQIISNASVKIKTAYFDVEAEYSCEDNYFEDGTSTHYEETVIMEAYIILEESFPCPGRTEFVKKLRGEISDMLKGYLIGNGEPRSMYYTDYVEVKQL